MHDDFPKGLLAVQEFVPDPHEVARRLQVQCNTWPDACMTEIIIPDFDAELGFPEKRLVRPRK